MDLQQVVSEQAALIEKLRVEIATLQTRIAILEKNSSHSSKPPASDIVKPSKPRKDKPPRKIGAQKGHPQHLRPPYPAEKISTSRTRRKPYIVTEYQLHRYLKGRSHMSYTTR